MMMLMPEDYGLCYPGSSNYDPITKLHYRTNRRVRAAKRKARPELRHYGWSTLNYATTYKLPPLQFNNIQRVDGRTLSVQEFRDRFENANIPVILTGLTDDWAAHRLLRKYRNQRFKCGEDDNGYSVKLKFKYYFDYARTNKDDSPLYIFDSSFGERHKTNKILADYTVPKFFEDDLFRYADMKKRPPHRWFVMGPRRSGTAIHVDPLGTSAWNALVHGHKRWVLIPPNAPRALVKPDKSECGRHPDEAVTWFNTVYRRVCSGHWPREYPAIECIQGPGETIFVPSGWWHVVFNEDLTVAVTQNFCSLANLHSVWPKTLRGRPKFSKHWFKRLHDQRPELIPMLEAAQAAPASEESSDSSSSSSSSSSDESNEDSGTENDKDASTSMRKRHCSKSDGGAACPSKITRSPAANK